MKKVHKKKWICGGIIIVIAASLAFLVSHKKEEITATVQDKITEKATEAIVDKVVDKVADKAKDKLKDEISKILP